MSIGLLGFSSLARPIASLALAAAAGVGLPGCGGGGYYHPAPVGTFSLGNDGFSAETIEAVEFSVFFGPVEHHDVLLLPGDFADFDLYDDSYDVNVFWSDGRVDHLTVDIYANATTTVILQN
jgi:hypothetical protein